MSPKINHASIISMFVNVYFNRQRNNRESKINKSLGHLWNEEKSEDMERGKGLRIKLRPLAGSGNILQPKKKAVEIDILRNQICLQQQNQKSRY